MTSHAETARSLVTQWEDRERYWLDGGIHFRARDSLIADIIAALESAAADAAPVEEPKPVPVQQPYYKKANRR